MKNSGGKLACSFCAAGLLSTAAQMLVLREAMNVAPENELTFGAVIGVWVLLVALGGLIGRAAGKWPALFPALGTILFVAGTAASVAFLRIAPLFGDRLAGELFPLLGFIALAVPALFPVAFGIGLYFPSQIAGSVTRDDIGAGAGIAWGCEAAGSVAAGVALSAFLFGNVNPFALVGGFGFLFCLANVYAAVARPARIAAGFCGLACLLLLVFSAQVDRFLAAQVFARSVASAGSVAVRETKLQRIVVAGDDRQRDIYRNGEYVFSVPSLDDALHPARLVHIALLEHPSPRRVLIAGPLRQAVADEAARYAPERIDYVLSDPEFAAVLDGVYRAAGAPPAQGGAARIVFGDVRRRMRGHPGEYDALFVMQSSSNRLRTVDFFADAKTALAPGGVGVFVFDGPGNFMDPVVERKLGSAIHGASAVFDDIRLLSGPVTLLIVAKAGGSTRLSGDLSVLAERMRVRNPGPGLMGHEYFVPNFRGTLDADPARLTSRDGRGWDAFPANTDFRPIGVVLGLSEFDRASTREFSRVFDFLLGVNTWDVFLVLGIVWVCVFLAAGMTGDLRRGRRIAIGWSVCVSGFAAMAGMVSFSYVFESFFGTLYRIAGLLVAVYMAGLAVGATLARAVVRKNLPPPTVLELTKFFLCVLAVLSPGCFSLLRDIADPLMQGGLLFTWVFAYAFVLGFEYPFHNRAYAECSDATSAGVSGWIFFADNAGAFCGALLAGIVLVPLLGIDRSFMLLAAAGLTALLTFRLVARKVRSA